MAYSSFDAQFGAVVITLFVIVIFTLLIVLLAPSLQQVNTTPNITNNTDNVATVQAIEPLNDDIVVNDNINELGDGEYSVLDDDEIHIDDDGNIVSDPHDQSHQSHNQSHQTNQSHVTSSIRDDVEDIIDSDCSSLQLSNSEYKSEFSTNIATSIVTVSQ